MRTTVRLPDDLIRRAKRKAAAEGRTLTALIEEGLRLAIKQEAGRPKGPPIPVSSATGGLTELFPEGTNLARAAQELEDIEYVERLNRGFK